MEGRTTTRELLDLGAVPEDEAARFDWAVGIVRLNATAREWEELKGRASGVYSAEERDFIEAVTHESMHFLQVVTTGFAYSFATDLFALVARTAAGTESAEEVVAALPALTAERAALFDRLEEAGPEGVTPLCLLESTAFLLQKHMNYQGLTAAHYERLLDEEAPGDEYRLAYDLTARHLGAEALDMLPLVAWAALCTTHPQDVFEPLLVELKRKGSKFDANGNYDLALGLLNRDFAPLLLGTAIEVAARGPSHPVYEPTVARLNEMAEEGTFAIRDVMTRTHDIGTELAAETVRPTIFNAESGEPTAMQLPDSLWRDEPPAVRRTNAEELVQLHLISMLALAEPATTHRMEET